MNETQKYEANRAFRRFSPFIRNYIYQHGWDELRQVQIQSANHIFYDDCNLLISSETASGKTEAAFFPVLSLMEEEGPENLQVLYISPLKSLINDQYSRMDEMLRESGLPVYRWHGDVSQSHKERFLKNPKGLLQITPESLESILCRRTQDVTRIFGNLKFVIIDEIHALMGTDRGNQILCQLQRISRLISYQPRRIALSATIGRIHEAAEWLSGGTARSTNVVEIRNDHTAWRLGLEHFFQSETKNGEADSASEMIYDATKKDKCVVFSNSREETETITATLRQIAKKRKEEDRFYIHHGNLSAAIRESAESALKNDESAITACATATLELGIDIGRLKRIINQGAPHSVSAFLQRLGRSGRRGNAPEMLIVFREEEALPNAPLYQIIPWDLLQAIAIIELYRTEHWIEPAISKPMPGSLLFHQTLSTLAGKGSSTPQQLAKEVLSLAPFSNFSKEEYRDLLIHLLKTDVLQKTDENELVTGLKGEKLLSGFKFYAVFKDSEDFTVRCGSDEIGTISSTPPIGEHFALAGKVWEVEEVDVSRRLVYVRLVEGKMKISWPGDRGMIHTRILEKMKEVLSSNESYPYLMKGAANRLEQARNLAKRTGVLSHNILSLGGNSFVLFPWLGTRSFDALKRLIQLKLAPELGLFDVQSGYSYYITFKSDKATPQNVIQSLAKWTQSTPLTLNDLTVKTEYPVTDKYDAYLPHDLLLNCYANNRLDLTEVKERVLSFVEK